MVSPLERPQSPAQPAAPAKPPPLAHDTHDIPEQMQIRPVRWRLRGPEDYYDDAVVDGTNGQALTEYDPFAEFDAEWEALYGR